MGVSGDDDGDDGDNGDGDDDEPRDLLKEDTLKIGNCGTEINKTSKDKDEGK